MNTDTTAKKTQHREVLIGRMRALREQLQADLAMARAVEGGILAFDPDGAIAEMVAGLDQVLAAEDARPIPAFMSDALKRRMQDQLDKVH